MRVSPQASGWPGIVILLAVSALASSLLAQAQSPQITTPTTDRPSYEVTGFRDVRFGMTEPEVRAAVTKTLGVKAADITTAANPIEGTNVLTAKVASLEPGPGPARVAYIFGHSSKRLIQVNVIWGEEAAAQPVDSIVAAGTRLQRYFSDFVWKKDAARGGIPVGDNTVVLFAADDEKKGSVRLIIDGVKYQMQREGQPATSPEPKGPPKLIINYIADRESPDIAKIERGKF
jgi:hypothetical protein